MYFFFLLKHGISLLILCVLDFFSLFCRAQELPWSPWIRQKLKLIEAWCWKWKRYFWSFFNWWFHHKPGLLVNLSCYPLKLFFSLHHHLLPLADERHSTWSYCSLYWCLCWSTSNLPGHWILSEGQFDGHFGKWYNQIRLDVQIFTYARYCEGKKWIKAFFFEQHQNAPP